MLFFFNNFDTKKSPFNSNHVRVFYIHKIVPVSTNFQGIALQKEQIM